LLIDYAENVVVYFFKILFHSLCSILFLFFGFEGLSRKAKLLFGNVTKVSGSLIVGRENPLMDTPICGKLN
jgi:hypothetical protein